MRSRFCITLVFISAFIHAQSEIKINSKTHFSIGDTLKFNSKILNEERTLNIYLPESYHKSESKDKYPVIYLLDGSADEDFIHIAGLVQFGSFSWINMVPESIVVGIANVDRKRDYTYHTDIQELKENYPTTGKSKIFIKFIESELKPLINKTYRTNGSKTLIGQSLGGLLATEILYKHPDMFDNYIIISPSLWWDDESLLDTSPKNYSTKKKIFVGVGKEGPVMEKSAKSLYKNLKSLNFKNTDLYYQYFEKQSHADTLHLAVYAAFEKMFMKTKDSNH